MTRVAALAAALAAALVAGAGAPAKVEGRLFGLLGTEAGQFVIEVDPGTLAPLPGRSLKLTWARYDLTPWSLDPSRHTLAIAHGDRLRLVNLSSLRPAGSVKLRSVMEPRGVVWLRPDRIVLLLRGFQQYEVAVVDAARRRVVTRRALSDGLVVDSDQTQSEVVMLRAPIDEIGEASLLVVDAGGEAREMALPRILAGVHVDRESTVPSATTNMPALALDRERRVAYVVTAGGLVAEVPLNGAGVRYHALRGGFTKLVSGSNRKALFLDGKIVVTGTDSSVSNRLDGTPAMRVDPAGLEVIDPATWQLRRLADGVSSVAAWPGGLVATGGSWSSPDRYSGGIGVAAFGLDGAERFRMLEGKRVWVFAVYGGKAFVQAENEGFFRVVDLESGREIGTRRGRVPWLLLEENAQVW
jgi:hypothetical protein